MFKAVNQRPRNFRGDQKEGSTNKAEIFEEWLQEIIKTPIFMNRILLKFLCIDEAKSVPFETYYDFSFKMFCSKNFLLNSYKKTEQTLTPANNRDSLIGHFSDEVEVESAHEKFIKLLKKPVYFTIEVDEDSLTETSMEFLILCESDKKTKIRWCLSKSEEQIVNLNAKIE